MSLPSEAYLDFTPDLRICRVLNGLWQVSGTHGRIEAHTAIPEMLVYHDAGFTTWDLADHYGPAEEFIGAFRRQLARERGEAALAQSQAFTKWVPMPGRVTRRQVTEAVDTSLRRMEMAALDLLQFHWWDYKNPAYLDALDYLAEQQTAGKIKHLALTNFDTAHLETIVARGIRVVSNQVQYSLLDQRPEVKMAAFCQEHGITLLTYGTVAGGLFSERYLGQSEPARRDLTTASLSKYKQMIDLWGGWELFQSLLSAMKQIADKHDVSLANVAVRAMLDRPAVAGVIIGARLGLAQHIADTTRVFSFALDDADRVALAAVTSQGRDLFQRIGDCGDEYRR